MDDYYDEQEYDDYEYDDAADDWEAEAAEEEQKAKAEEVARKLRAEKKLATRAPIKEEVEETEAVPEDVERAITDMRQVANDVASGSALLGGDAAEGLIGNASIAEPEDVDRVGEMIAQRLLSFSDSPNFDKLIADVLERLTKQMTTSALLTEEADRVHRLREELKRAAKTKSKVVEKALAPQARLDLDNFEDKGGAHVAEENEDETGW
jgi:translation initiation factor 3 subunit J